MKKTVSANIMSLVNMTKPKKRLKESVDEDNIELFMNTWANYNEYGADEGITPTGWMDLEKAKEYCNKYADYEPFINDYENSPIELSEYDNAPSRIEELIKYEGLSDDEKKTVKGLIEADYANTIDEALDKMENKSVYFISDVESTSDLGEKYVDWVGGFEGISNIERYFDEDRYREENEDDIRNLIMDNEGYDSIDDVTDEELNSYMDSIINDDLSMAQYNGYEFLSNYFDYNQLGEDLLDDGWTIIDDGAIFCG